MSERIHNIWTNMKQRCDNPNRKDFKYYGGKGITVCPEWENSFYAFKEWAYKNGYSDNLTIERENINGNYSPQNCTWIPFSRQRENTTQNRLITINGKTQNLKAWCKELGKNYDTVAMRLHRGASDIDALMQPKGWRRSHA